MYKNLTSTLATEITVSESDAKIILIYVTITLTFHGNFRLRVKISSALLLRLFRPFAIFAVIVSILKGPLRNCTEQSSSQLLRLQQQQLVTQLISLMTSVARFVEDIGEQLEFLLFSLNEETERLLWWPYCGSNRHLLAGLIYCKKSDDVTTNASYIELSSSRFTLRWFSLISELRPMFIDNMLTIDFLALIASGHSLTFVKTAKCINIIMKVLSSKDLDDCGSKTRENLSVYLTCDFYCIGSGEISITLQNITYKGHKREYQLKF
uniref:Uncharacterized protein n=1 Tax=Glossina austeni TaxID=7395 RepID=A0A1A9V240_GLOAU